MKHGLLELFACAMFRVQTGENENRYAYLTEIKGETLVSPTQDAEQFSETDRNNL